jgi:hypothetical protein
MRMSTVSLLVLVACGGTAPPSAPAVRTAQEQFWDNLAALCGQAFEGTITVNTGGKTPDPMEGQRLRMHVRTCSDREIRVPFHVGEDRSRVWVFTRTQGGLRREHDHRHADGTADAVTMYGGDTVDGGTATEQRFPASEGTQALFVREGLAGSVSNVWVVEIVPGVRFGYGLRRPGREFRARFDLTAPVEAPAAPWGSAPGAPGGLLGGT